MAYGEGLRAIVPINGPQILLGFRDSWRSNEIFAIEINTLSCLATSLLYSALSKLVSYKLVLCKKSAPR